MASRRRTPRVIDCARTSQYTGRCADAWSAGVLNPSGIVLRDPLAACSHPMCLREGRGDALQGAPLPVYSADGLQGRLLSRLLLGLGRGGLGGRGARLD